MIKQACKLSAVLLLFLSGQCLAEVKIVVHSSVADDAVTSSEAANVFLGKTKTLPSGHKTVPIDQEEGEEPRDEFYTKVTKKDASQLKAYWSRLIFTGKGQPPKAVLDDTEVLELVASNPNIIGYVSGDADTSGVKVLLTVE